MGQIPENQITWAKCYEDGWKDHIIPEINNIFYL